MPCRYYGELESNTGRVDSTGVLGWRARESEMEAKKAKISVYHTVQIGR